MPTPEELARQNIDKLLTNCGGVIQDMSGLNRYASLGVAVREFPVTGGEADYLLFVDGKAVGVIEAKQEGTTLSGVAEQAGHYVVGLPPNIPHVTLPLPFQYESTGVETLGKTVGETNSTLTYNKHINGKIRSLDVWTFSSVILRKIELLLIALLMI